MIEKRLSLRERTERGKQKGIAEFRKYFENLWDHEIYPKILKVADQGYGYYEFTHNYCQIMSNFNISQDEAITLIDDFLDDELNPLDDIQTMISGETSNWNFTIRFAW